MANLGRRRGDGVTYQRGSKDTDTELERLQSWAEHIDPCIKLLEEDVRELRDFRNTVSGVMKVVAALQVVIVGILIAMFSWGLNHMTFHSDYEPPQHSQVQKPQAATE